MPLARPLPRIGKWVLLIASAALLAGCAGSSSPGNGGSTAEGSLTRIPVGRGPSGVVLADLNRDGRLDLVVANETSRDASILFGDGTGRFESAPGSPRPAGTMPTDIATSDFDGDGRLDLAIANHETSYVTVLLARDGFASAPGSPFDTGSRPHVHSVSAGDLDGDGASDLAVESVDTDSVGVLFGDGRGGFEPARHFAAGQRPYFRLRVGDVDGDGVADVVAPNSGGDTVTILTADGRGGLVPAPGSPHRAGRGPHSVAIGDVNGDRRPDLAILHFGTSDVTVLLGNGVHEFRPAPGSPFTAGSDPTNLALGDVDGDGVLDVAVSNLSSNDITLLTSGGSSTAGRMTRRLAAGRSPREVALGDLNGDGRADLVVANFLDDDVGVWLSR